MRYLPIRLAASLCAAALLVLLPSCGGDSTGPTPSQPVPGSLTLVGGDAQSGVVGAALAQPLVVTVKDTDGAVLSGQAVTWSVTSGGGSVSSASTTSGSDGSASVTWTLGGSVGAQTVTATVSSFTVTFTATAAAGAQATVVVTPATEMLEALGATVQLTAEVKDAFGNTTGGTVTWASSDEAVITVDAQGLATAVANGTADVTATSEDLSGTAALTVTQAVASVVVTPENPTASKGGTTQLSAEAKDANGFAVADAAFTWTSSDETVATVDGTGLVSGVEEGQAQIAAAAGEGADTVTVTVSAAPFNPTGDTELDGTVNVAAVDIPAGVTVTLTGNAVINAAGDVTIAGTITGDCQAASITAGGSLTLTGNVTNDCADTTQAGQDLVFTAQGAMTIEDATLSSSGSVIIDNTGAAAAGAPSPFRASLMAAEGSQACVHRNSTIWIRREARSGLSGSPRGGDGEGGGSVTIRCAGDMTFLGAFVVATGGGHGGRGHSSGSEMAVGGNGGDGGDITINAPNLTFGLGSNDRPTYLIPGSGGGGGFGDATGMSPRAQGGRGGRIGLPFITAGTINVEEGSLIIAWEHANLATVGRGGEGGAASAEADNGASATESTPAVAGYPAEATGGLGGSVGLPDRTTNVIGDLIVGILSDPTAVTILGAEAGRGGGASGSGGNGGAGSETFPNGANGGMTRLTGGDAGPVTLYDNRGGVFLGTGYDGGGAGFYNVSLTRTASGGHGWSDCRVGNVRPGGNGGDAGTAIGAVGDPSTRGSGTEGNTGNVAYAAFGNGGNGGDGLAPGTGGDPSDNTLVIGPVITVIEPSLQRGTDGNPCSFGVDASVQVTSDPNGHAPFIALSPSTLTVTMGEGNAITISGNGNWVTVTGTVDSEGNFITSGSGTVAGYSNVPVSFEGMLILDANGRATGIKSGVLTMDSSNTNLPPNGDGVRNPAVYSVTGLRIFN